MVTWTNHDFFNYFETLKTKYITENRFLTYTAPSLAYYW